MTHPDWDRLIRQHRLRFGLTQQALADRLNVSQKTVSRWESAEAKPRGVHQLRLRDLLRRPCERDLSMLMAAVKNCPTLRAFSRHERLTLLALSPPVLAKNPERAAWTGRDLISIAKGVLAMMLDDTALEKSIQKGEVACIRVISQSNFEERGNPAPTSYQTVISFVWLDGVIYRDAISVLLPSPEPNQYWPLFCDEMVSSGSLASREIRLP